MLRDQVHVLRSFNFLLTNRFNKVTKVFMYCREKVSDMDGTPAVVNPGTLIFLAGWHVCTWVRLSVHLCESASE